MNRIYRSVWNPTTRTYVAVSEAITSAGKKSSPGTGVRVGVVEYMRFAVKALAISLMMAFGANVLALPVGGIVAKGGASISSTAGSTTIVQSSQNVAINWQSFSIGQSEAVRFVQPNSSAVALNRVLGPDPSSILGSLSANGKVFLVNPNGILFARGAQVNVGGLVAATLNISDSDFMAGRYRFAGKSDAAVLNQGSINADGGQVALLAATVGNDGVIVARLGAVALAAGSAMSLDLAGDGLINVTVSQGAVNALVHNGGLIQADGGQVLMTTQAAGELLQTAVNNSGVIQARSLENRNGTIRLLGDMQAGTVNLAGTLDVSGSAAGQTGGSVIVTGHHVGLVGARIDASADAGGGTVLIGGGYQGKNPAVANASASYMSADSIIVADATRQGNGGTVVLWADNSTRAYGDISARGGALGGNGGLIETSGHALDVDGIRVNASAPNGNRGMWLLDPADVTITAATTSGTFNAANPDVFSPNAGVNAATVAVGTIKTALEANTGVTINTTNVGGAGSGDITLASALTWTAVGAATTLTLNAVRDIVLNAALTATTGHVVANAGRDLNVAAPVTLTNGNFTACCGRDIRVTAAMTTTDGGVTLNAGRDIIVSSKMTTTRGNVVLRAGADGSGPAGLIGGTITLPTGVNAYTVTGAVGTPVAVTVDYTPTSYATPTSYVPNFILTDAVLTQHMLVFATGNNKVYDGNTTATLTMRGTPTLGGAVTLLPGTASFDSKNVAANIGITYSGFSLGGADAAKFALWAACAPGLLRTSAAITPAPLTLRANDNTKVYGQTFTPATTAFTVVVAPVAGETVTAVTETSTGSPPTASVAGSTYPIVITPGSATGTILATNYTITLVDGALSVTPAPLTLRANDASKVFGTTFTPLATAFTTPVAPQNGETVTGVTETSTGSPPAASVAGSTYPIVITPGSPTGTITASNYTITLQNGALSVTPAGAAPPVVPPIVVPPIVVPPIATTPIETTPVETTPVETAPIALAELEPEEMMGPDATLFTTPVLPTTVVRTATPPQLLALLPPVLPVPVPLIAMTPEPIIVPAEAPPQVFAPPLRPLKQDRN